MDKRKVDPPLELFFDQFSGITEFNGFPFKSRDELIGSRIQNQYHHGLRESFKGEEPNLVFVYKFSHVEILKEKLEITIERPTKQE